MSWFWIIAIGGVICCVIASLQEDERAKQQARNEALLPEKLSMLLGQELPAFKDEFTYARCTQAIRWLNDRSSQRLFVFTHIFSSAQEKADAERVAHRVYAEHVAILFGVDVANFAAREPQVFGYKFASCLHAARTLAVS